MIGSATGIFNNSGQPVALASPLQGTIAPGKGATVPYSPSELLTALPWLGSLCRLDDMSGKVSQVDTQWQEFIPAEYGDGSHGQAIFDGVTTFNTFSSLAGSTYTLTRDTFLADGSTINAGITLYTAGFRLFCKGRLINNGTIHNNGKDAAGAVAGTATPVGTLGIGVAGGAGHAGVAAGTGGTNAPAPNTLADGSGAGGAGGAGGAQAGGAAGTYVPAAANGGANFLAAVQSGFLFASVSGGNQGGVTIMCGGAGGGGGGSDNAGVTAGGGGGGGGVMILCVYWLQNNGVISCNGGKGADAAGAGGNGGGGGGGGGGLIQSLSRFRSGSGTMTVAGGLGGAKIGGTGVVGAPGSVGHINQVAA